MNRRHFLRCLPTIPTAAAAAAAAIAMPATAAQVGLVEPGASGIAIGDEIDGHEVMDMCESCSKPLFEGDKVFSYSDGPTFCEAHAPTWNDLKAMQDEQIADGTWADNFEEPQHAKDAIDSVLAEIFGGHGDEKYVWSL